MSRHESVVSVPQDAAASVQRRFGEVAKFPPWALFATLVAGSALSAVGTTTVNITNATTVLVPVAGVVNASTGALVDGDLLKLVSTGSERFAAESEILLNLAQRGCRIDSVRITTVYADEKSKIRAIPDTIRFFRMLMDYRRRTRRKPEPEGAT